MTVSRYAVDGSAILEELSGCGITHIATVPDWVQMSVHKLLEEGYLPEASVIPCSTEDEAIVIAAGLHIGCKTPAVMIQNQGVYACVNALRGMGLDARMPIFMIVGQFGREFANLGDDPDKSSRLVVRKTEPLLEALGIPYLRMEGPQDLENVRKVFEIAHERESPAALLVGANTAWNGASGGKE